MVLAAAGCNPGVRWELRPYSEAHQLAQNSGKLTFVYLRNWYMVECTDFEEKVLKDPEVLAETHTMVCVPLNFDYDRPLAEQWQLKKPPAYVIVGPDDQVLARHDAPVRRDELLLGIRTARDKFAARDRSPATSP